MVDDKFTFAVPVPQWLSLDGVPVALGIGLTVTDTSWKPFTSSLQPNGDIGVIL